MKPNLSSLHKCGHCELNFLSKEGMEKHTARVHQVKSADFTRYKCEKCKSDFKSKPDFKQHKLPAKTTGSCSVCLKSLGNSPEFANICEYTAHKNSHVVQQAEPSFSCNECGTEFPQKALLRKHMKNTSKVPCGKVGCAELLFGECNRLKHWKNHGTSAPTSALKSNPTPQTLKTILNNAFSTSLQDSRNNSNDRYNSKENARNPSKPVDKISSMESVGKTFKPFPSNFTMKPLPVPLQGNTLGQQTAFSSQSASYLAQRPSNNSESSENKIKANVEVLDMASIRSILRGKAKEDGRMTQEVGRKSQEVGGKSQEVGNNTQDVGRRSQEGGRNSNFLKFQEEESRGRLRSQKGSPGYRRIKLNPSEKRPSENRNEYDAGVKIVTLEEQEPENKTVKIEPLANENNVKTIQELNKFKFDSEKSNKFKYVTDKNNEKEPEIEKRGFEGRSERERRRNVRLRQRQHENTDYIASGKKYLQDDPKNVDVKPFETYKKFTAEEKNYVKPSERKVSDEAQKVEKNDSIKAVAERKIINAKDEAKRQIMKLLGGDKELKAEDAKAEDKKSKADDEDAKADDKDTKAETKRKILELLSSDKEEIHAKDTRNFSNIRDNVVETEVHRPNEYFHYPTMTMAQMVKAGLVPEDDTVDYFLPPLLDDEPAYKPVSPPKPPASFPLPGEHCNISVLGF